MASSSTFVSQLYQTFLARDADTSSNYWTAQLDSGFITKAQVAYSFVTSQEYSQGVEAVARLYYAAFKRAPDLPGLQFWMKVSRLGGTLDQISTQFVGSSEFTSLNGAVDNNQFIDVLYQNVLGRTADTDGKAYWLGQLQNGLAKGSVLAGFSNSSEFQSKTNLLIDNTLAYYVFAGRAPTTAELAATPADITSIVLNASAKTPVGGGLPGVSYDSLIVNESTANDGSISNALTITLAGGDAFKGIIGASLGKLTGTPSGLTGFISKITDTSALLTFSGNAKAHGLADSSSAVSVAFATTDFTSGSIAGKSGVTQAITVSFFQMPLTESSGNLAPSGTIPSNVLIDLANDKFYFGTSLASLTSGAMANVINVDARGLSGTTQTVSTTGDDAANTIISSPLGGTITGGKGDDPLTAGTGIDRFVFAANSTDNGADTITGFTLGTGGDVLNFSAFLNKTGTSHIAAVGSGNTANATWANGDVLVASGNGLTTAAAAALLFNSGTNAPFAAPTAAAKIVLITADIIGDASIWYIVNNTVPGVIAAAEITLVGTLKNVNNLSLAGYGFAASNFA